MSAKSPQGPGSVPHAGTRRGVEGAETGFGSVLAINVFSFVLRSDPISEEDPKTHESGRKIRVQRHNGTIIIVT